MVCLTVKVDPISVKLWKIVSLLLELPGQYF